MCPNGILAVGCIPIGSVVILVMGHYYKFLSKHSNDKVYHLLPGVVVRVLWFPQPLKLVAMI
jgi:hypothetical protein